MLSDLPLILLRSLAVTLALETAAAALLGCRGKRELAVVALVNLLTNPPLVIITFLVQYVAARPVYYAVLAVCEAAAVLTEAFIYKKSIKTRLRPLLFSLLLNALSFGAGLAVNALWKI